MCAQTTLCLRSMVTTNGLVGSYTEREMCVAGDGRYNTLLLASFPGHSENEANISAS